MTARAIGAFFAALIVLGYLIPIERDAELLALVGFAAVVGLATALWLRRSERVAVDPFDERATKRAVRRGVIRTALIVVVWLIAGFAATSCASNAWQLRGGRTEHLQRVVQYGFGAANPGYRNPSLSSCCATSLRWLEIGVSAERLTAERASDRFETKVRIGLRDRLRDEPLRVPPAPVDAADGGTPSKADTLEIVRGLPRRVSLVAVVELQPQPVDAVYRLLTRARVDTGEEFGVFLEGPGSVRHTDRHFDRRVGWPTPYVAQFQSWAKSLDDGDDRVLDGLQLPPSRKLKELASDPRIHALILKIGPNATIRLLLEREVRGVALADAELDVSGVGP